VRDTTRRPCPASGYDIALVTTDLTATPQEIISRYAARWSIEVTFFDVKEVVKAVPRLGEYDNAAMPPMDKIPLSGKNSMASISNGDKERLREKERKEVPPVPPLPQKYALDTKQPTPYPMDVKVPLQPSTKSTLSYYPADIKHPLPPSQPKSSYLPPTQHSIKQPIPKHSHSGSYTSYPPPQPNPILTNRR